MVLQGHPLFCASHLSGATLKIPGSKSTLRSRFVQLNLKQRILALALVPAIGLMLVFLVEKTTAQRLNQSDEVYSNQQILAHGLVDLQTELMSLRLMADEFRHSRSKKSEIDFRNASETAAAKLDAIRRTSTGDVQKAVQELSVRATELARIFENFVNVNNRLGRAVGEGITGAVTFANATIKGEMLSQNSQFGPWYYTAIEAVHELSVAERDYQMHLSHTFLQRHETLLSHLVTQIKSSTAPADIKESILTKLESYRRHFMDWVDTAQLGQTVFNRMNVEYVLTLQELAKLKKSIDETAKAAGESRLEIHSARSTYLFVTLGGVILVSGLLAMTLGMQISRSVNQIVEAMAALARGDNSVEAKSNSAIAEIREMAGALNVFKANALEREQLANDQARLSTVEAERVKSIDGIIERFEQAVSTSLNQLHSASSRMQEVSQALDHTAAEAEAQAISAAGETDKAANEIEAASVASQQLSTSVQEVATQALRSDEMASAALKEAERAQSAMGDLEVQTAKIGEIIGLIETIASQTNLLALNATIEAARAGDAGRGFAVVASEVKGLAAQTSHATGEIAQHIAGMRAASSGVVSAIEAVNATISEVSRIAASVAAAVEEQSVSLNSMALNVVAASEGATRGAMGIRHVEEAVSTTTQNAASVTDISGMVSREAATLNEQISWFLKEVRAA
jgi:methyl-accepting chemotaxis protein